MYEASTPWDMPVVEGAASGGVTGQANWQTIGNDGAQSQRLQGSSPVEYANCPMLVRLHGKPQETAGRKA